MLYSPYTSIANILHNYNICSVTDDYCVYGYTFTLKNLISDLTVALDCDKPLYNVVYPIRTITQQDYDPTLHTEKTLIYTNNINNIPQIKSKAKVIFNTDYTSNISQFTNTYIKSAYYVRHKTLRHNGTIPSYSNEYIAHYTESDINKILTSFGMNITVKKIVGKFFIDSEDNVRLVIMPKTIILENVNDIYFSNMYIWYGNGESYPQQYLIYNTIGDVDNIKLLYYNSIVQLLTNTPHIEVSLSSVFESLYPTFNTDIINDNLINSKIFVVSTLLTVGIFINTSTGIIRYVPKEFTSNFFNRLFTNMALVPDLSFKYQYGVMSTKLTDSDYITGYEYNNVISNSIRPVLTSTIIPWTPFNDVSSFDKLLTLTSNADYFNDLIFSISEVADSITVPILLISEM